MTDSLEPNDVRIAAQSMIDTLSPVADKEWAFPAANLEWSCRYTLDHAVSALASYSMHLATRATARRPRFRDMNPNQSIEELLAAVESGAAILAEVCTAAPDDARGFHQAGMADWSGFIGMGCTEILIHTDDIARTFDLPFVADQHVARRVLNRLFPWAPKEGDHWQILRWATGRTALPGIDALDEHWSWHCKPLDEWDGTIPRYLTTSPPR